MRSRIAILPLLGVSLLLTAAPCGSKKIDHYRGYPILQFFGPPPPPSVTLRDQFLSSFVPLGGPVYFMPPVDKNDEGIIRRVPHLTCYRVPEAFQAHILVKNQFGEQPLTVGDSRMLCVPTEKFPQQPPATLNIDHYRCYDAAGAAVNKTVSLQDQFQLQTAVVVLEPRLFCNPVDKNGEGIKNKKKHLTCYDTQPPGVAPGSFIPIRNQFHSGELLLGEPDLLCVPSNKLEVNLPCGSSIAPACNGFCPSATQVCRPVAGSNLCDCVESPTPCGGIFPQCSGDCPQLNQVCTHGDGSDLCECVETCGGTFPQCVGPCSSAAATCTPDSPTGLCLCTP